MAESYNFDSGFVLGDGIGRLGREELVELARKLCLALMDVEGGYHGCVHPYNVSLAPDGAAGLGPKADHGPGSWTTWELEYMAPELFWNGSGDATVDVYSVGLLLYSGVTGGRLPFFPKSGETTNVVRAGALRDRMNGRDIPMPLAAGGRLGKVIRTALSYEPVERYSGPVELLSALSECVGEGERDARELFGKGERELTEQERMLCGLVSPDVEGEREEEPEELPEAPETIATEAIETHKPEATPEKEKENADEDGKAPEKSEDGEAQDAPEAVIVPEERVASDPVLEEIIAEEEAKKLAVPTRAKKPAAEKKPSPEYKVDKDFEKNAPKRRLHLKPILIILILIFAMAVIGFATRELWLDFVYEGGEGRIPAIDVTVPPTPTEKPPVTPRPAQSTPVSQPTPTAAPTPTPTPKPRYELFVEDISWTDAELACEALGGHLVTISDGIELKEVTAVAEAKGIDLIWIGFYRDMSATLKWVNDEDILFFAWAAGEPSVSDTDGTPENYGLLWRRDGKWVYNDSRNDPAADYPQYYSGKIGYICEYD